MERRFYLKHELENPNCPENLSGIFKNRLVMAVINDANSETEDWSKYLERKNIDGLVCIGCGGRLTIPPLRPT